MTIKEYIIENTISGIKARLNTLKSIGAPEVMVKSCEDELNRLAEGNLKCGGNIELLEEEFISDELRRGRGGIPYHVLNGNINYFPKAKYGRFIAKGEVK